MNKEGGGITGSMTVNFKMNVTTSGAHDGLFITTGVQTGGSGFSYVGTTNGMNAQSTPWWKSIPDKMPPALAQPSETIFRGDSKSAIQLSETPSTSALLPGQETATSFRKEEEIYTVQRKSPSYARLNDDIDIKTSEQKDTYNISGSYTSTTAAGGIVPVARPRKASPSTSRTNEYSDTFQTKDSRKPTSHDRAASLEESNDFLPPTSVKLNVFDSGKPVELSLSTRDENRAKSTEYLVDATTTTTTVEVFRGDLSSEVDYFKLPPEPYSRDGKPQLIRAHGSPYEVASWSGTKFSDLKPGSQIVLDRPIFRDFASPTHSTSQPYIVREPSSTSISMGTGHYETVQPGPSRSQSRGEWRPTISAQSTPASSVWNLQANEPSSATILRTQRSEHAGRRIERDFGDDVSRSPDKYTSVRAPRMTEQSERKCPPVPPKRYPIRHAASQPDIMPRYAPPRPSAPKPQPIRSSRTGYAPQCYGLYQERKASRSPARPDSTISGGGERRSRYDEENPYEDIRGSRGTSRYRHVSSASTQQRRPVPKMRYPHRPRSSTGVSPFPQQMGLRSASSNEIFKLYQTRDCLGNVLFEL
ncbi:hypothetical protein DdX_07154 [Ditylenchus destructor]|uniref:Uncharacterized protein n=1 Tax=Ditylenchus destructor TaxID=166010 RepID=A0AAD4R8N9_9BILA|nr:hypothetical protein DdX_07154 [Ditylenchus destructor]